MTDQALEQANIIKEDIGSLEAAKTQIANPTLSTARQKLEVAFVEYSRMHEGISDAAIVNALNVVIEDFADAFTQSLEDSIAAQQAAFTALSCAPQQ